jgi:integral membrane protein
MSNDIFAAEKTLKMLRALSFIEGSSLLLLMLVAMPVKYILGEPRLVSIVGMVHGMLFIALILLIFLVSNARQWSKSFMFFGFVCSTLPFGMFFYDRKLKEKF